MATTLDPSSLPERLSLQTRQALIDQMNWVSERARQKRGLLYFPPSIGWGIAAFQRPHHLARAFATLEWAVVFDVNNAADPVLGFLEVEPDIFLFKGPETLLAHLPVTVVWAFVYNLHQRTSVTPSSLLIYDIIDSLEVFPYPKGRLERNHLWGLRYADAVTVVSRGLLAEVQAARPDALYLPNACEAYRFDPGEVDTSLPERWQMFFSRFQPRLATYVGSLAQWFDFPLVRTLAQELPHWGFFIAGPILERCWPWEQLWQQPNVLYAGPQPYPFLPFLLCRASVGLIPFVQGPVLRGLSPLKMYEFLAAGKPLVATPFPEAEGVPGVITAADAQSFAHALESALGLGPEDHRAMRAFAAENTWMHRAQAVLDALPQLEAHSSAPWV